VPGGNSDQRLVDFCEIGLTVVKLLHVFCDASVVVFLLQVNNGAEISAVRPVLALLGAEVDGVALEVVVHGVDTSGDIDDHCVGQSVEAMLSVHFNDTEVAIEFAVEIEDTLHLLVAAVVIVGDEALGGDVSLGVDNRSLLLN